MKKIIIVAGYMVLAVAMISCNNIRRDEGRAYMPDMAYSRAYETYASTEALDKAGVNYISKPVDGTIARGEMAAYPFKNDSIGYVRSAEVKNPLDISTIDMKEAERLYLVNCGICHGAKLDGNGPLWNGGNGAFPNAPRNLLTDPLVANMAEGTMFHSVTYGRNNMGGYASQMSTKQRWEVVAYIKAKQGQGSTVPAPAAAPSDSAAAAKK